MTLPAHLEGKGAKARNQRAKKHGARSEITLAPVREQQARMLRERYPALDDVRLALLADRLARCQVASAWIDEHGMIADRHGRVRDVADKLERWSRAAERVLAQVEAEHKGRPGLDLATAMSELAEEVAGA